VSASVNLPLHNKVQKFSSGTGSPGSPGKSAVKRLLCGGGCAVSYIGLLPHMYGFIVLGSVSSEPN